MSLCSVPLSETPFHCLNVNEFAAKLWLNGEKVGDVRGQPCRIKSPWFLRQTKTNVIFAEIIDYRCYRVNIHELSEMKHVHGLSDPVQYVDDQGYERIFIYHAIKHRLFKKTLPRIHPVKRGGVTWSKFAFINEGLCELFPPRLIKIFHFSDCNLTAI